MLGVALGFVLMLMLVGVFETYPVSYTILKMLSVAYLIYLARKIASAPPPSDGSSDARPMAFLQTALFQWVNPKAWAMALTAVTVYAPTQSLVAIAFVGLVFGAINLPSVGS